MKINSLINQILVKYELKYDLKTFYNKSFENKDLFELETEERAHKGIFLAFQYPLEIPGVNTNIFLILELVLVFFH